MKLRSALVFCLVFLNSLLCNLYSQSSSAKLNIVFFLVDDMGWQDCSVPFYKEKTKQNEQFRTPNMERLAAKGMKFTNAYAYQNCTPTRISLMTGMNVINHHVTTWSFTKNKNSEPDALGIQQPDWNKNGFSNEPGYENTIYATALPQLLKKEGYKTIHIGKAHFGPYETHGADPKNLGFDVNIAGSAAGQPGTYFGLDSFGNTVVKKNIRAVPGLEKYWGQDIFLSEAITLEAINQMDKAWKETKPFFLYLSHFAVHTPIVPDKRFVQRYYDMGLDSIETKYASLVEGMDKSLGDIMDYLEKNNLAENTVIIFISDNGGLTDVARGGNKNFHNAPLRSGKTSGFEGGLRVPMLMYWPGITKPASINTNNIIIEDMFPSILSIAGIKKSFTIQKIDGLDFSSSITNDKRLPQRLLTWHYPHVHERRNKDVQPFSIIRDGDWKLIYFHLDTHFELYNTQNDISEKNNLFEKEKQRVRLLANELGKRLKESKSLMPILQITGKPVSFPDEIVF